VLDPQHAVHIAAENRFDPRVARVAAEPAAKRIDRAVVIQA
jgi:hypothetical protein